MSKQLERALDRCVLKREISVLSSTILCDFNIYRTVVVTHGSMNSQSKTKEEKDKDCAEVNTFVKIQWEVGTRFGSVPYRPQTISATTISATTTSATRKDHIGQNE